MRTTKVTYGAGLAAALVVAIVADGARAEPWAPDVPEDPWALQQARQWFEFYWRDCRERAYPDEDVDKVGMDFALELRTPGRRTQGVAPKLRGVLSVAVYDRDDRGKKKIQPNRAQRGLIQCVKRRFEARRFFSAGDRSLVGSRWILIAPRAYEVVQHGRLVARPAADYVAGQIATARAACKVGKAAAAISATVEVNADGSVGAITLSGAPPDAEQCIQARLTKRLRFPVTTESTRVTATE